MTTLPEPTLYLNQSNTEHNWPSSLNTAYQQIRTAESHAISQNNESGVIHARVAGYFLLEFHKRAPYIGSEAAIHLSQQNNRVSSENEENSNANVYEIRVIYRYFMLRACASKSEMPIVGWNADNLNPKYFSSNKRLK